MVCMSLQFSWRNYGRQRGCVPAACPERQKSPKSKERLWLNSQNNYKPILSWFGIKDWGSFSPGCRYYLGALVFMQRIFWGWTLLLWLTQFSNKKVLIGAVQFDLSEAFVEVIPSQQADARNWVAGPWVGSYKRLPGKGDSDVLAIPVSEKMGRNTEKGGGGNMIRTWKMQFAAKDAMAE